MSTWEPKHKIMLILVLIVPLYLIILFVDRMIGPQSVDAELEMGKEIMIYILGMVSGLLAHGKRD